MNTDIRQEIILLRTHDDLCEGILNENSDSVWAILKSNKDVTDKLNCLLDKNLEIEAMIRLGL